MSGYLRSILSENKTPVTLSEGPMPTPQADEVLIELHAAALNRRDYWITQGMYPGITYPCTLGSDGAGIISAIGSTVQNFKAGDEVIINPGQDWGDDQNVQSDAFRILGMPQAGTHATHVICKADLLHAKPAHLNWHQAAALPLAYVTAYRAIMSQGLLQTGQSVLISGIGGGVALAALQIAKAAGATVFVTSSDADKRQRAEKLGADASYDYRAEKWQRALSKDHGPVDLIIDGSGGEGLNAAIDVCKPGGKIVIYGATAGAPKHMDLFKIFWKQIHLIGTSMGSEADFAHMLSFVAENSLLPIIDKSYPLSQINDAYVRQASSEHFGKITIDCQDH